MRLLGQAPSWFPRFAALDAEVEDRRDALIGRSRRSISPSLRAEGGGAARRPRGSARVPRAARGAGAAAPTPVAASTAHGWSRRYASAGAPDAPIGCPMAIAPPLTLTLAGSQPMPLTAQACAARLALSWKAKTLDSREVREAAFCPLPSLPAVGFRSTARA